MFTLNRVNHKVSGVQILLLWNTIGLEFDQNVIESLLNYFYANIFYLDQIKSLVTFFDTHNTCPIKAFVKLFFLAIVQSSKKNMLHKERKNYFLDLIEVSINTMYKHVKAKEYIWRIGGKEKKHTHTHNIPHIATFAPLVHIFLPTWMPRAEL